MVWSNWRKAGWVLLAGVVLAWCLNCSLFAQTPAAKSEQYLSLQENGKNVAYKVRKSWPEPNGARGYELQALDTGKIVIIHDSGKQAGPTTSGPGQTRQAVSSSIVPVSGTQSAPTSNRTFGDNPLSQAASPAKETVIWWEEGKGSASNPQGVIPVDSKTPPRFPWENQVPTAQNTDSLRQEAGGKGQKTGTPLITNVAPEAKNLQSPRTSTTSQPMTTVQTSLPVCTMVPYSPTGKMTGATGLVLTSETISEKVIIVPDPDLPARKIRSSKISGDFGCKLHGLFAKNSQPSLIYPVASRPEEPATSKTIVQKESQTQIITDNTAGNQKSPDRTPQKNAVVFQGSNTSVPISPRPIATSSKIPVTSSQENLPGTQSQNPFPGPTVQNRSATPASPIQYSQPAKKQTNLAGTMQTAQGTPGFTPRTIYSSTPVTSSREQTATAKNTNTSQAANTKAKTPEEKSGFFTKVFGGSGSAQTNPPKTSSGQLTTAKVPPTSTPKTIVSGQTASKTGLLPDLSTTPSRPTQVAQNNAEMQWRPVQNTSTSVPVTGEKTTTPPFSAAINPRSTPTTEPATPARPSLPKTPTAISAQVPAAVPTTLTNNVPMAQVPSNVQPRSVGQSAAIMEKMQELENPNQVKPKSQTAKAKEGWWGTLFKRSAATQTAKATTQPQPRTIYTNQGAGYLPQPVLVRQPDPVANPVPPTAIQTAKASVEQSAPNPIQQTQNIMPIVPPDSLPEKTVTPASPPKDPVSPTRDLTQTLPKETIPTAPAPVASLPPATPPAAAFPANPSGVSPKETVPAAQAPVASLPPASLPNSGKNPVNQAAKTGPSSNKATNGDYNSDTVVGVVMSMFNKKQEPGTGKAPESTANKSPTAAPSTKTEATTGTAAYTNNVPKVPEQKSTPQTAQQTPKKETGRVPFSTASPEDSQSGLPSISRRNQPTVVEAKPEPTPPLAIPVAGADPSAASANSNSQAPGSSAGQRNWRNMWGKSQQTAAQSLDPSGSKKVEPAQGVKAPVPLNNLPVSVTENRNNDILMNPEKFDPASRPQVKVAGGVVDTQKFDSAIQHVAAPAPQSKTPVQQTAFNTPASTGSSLPPAVTPTTSQASPPPALPPSPPPPSLPAGPPVTVSPGSQSVLAAGNGLNRPVAYVPVPMVTIPDPVRPPVPPAPKIPDAPQPAMYVNAFTPPANPQPPQNQAGMPNGSMPNAQAAMMNPAMMALAYAQNPYLANPMMLQQVLQHYGELPQQQQVLVQQALFLQQQSFMLQQQALFLHQQQSAMQRNMQGLNYQANYQGPQPPNPYGSNGQPYQAASPTPYYQPQGNPQYIQQTSATRPVPYQQTSSQPNVQQLIGQLVESPYPAQREWAAHSLSNFNWRSQPQVVQVLMQAARQDPAASVRAGCVYTLARMNVATDQVQATLQSLQNDPDPRVRQEVQQAFTRLGFAQNR